MLCPIYMSCPLCSNSHPHPSSKCPVCPQNWPAATTCINRHYQKAVQVHVIQNRVMLVSFLYFDIDKNQRRGTCLLVLSVVIGIALWLYNVHICHCDILTKPLKLYRCFCNHCWFLSNFILFLIEIVSCATLAPDTKIPCQSKIESLLFELPLHRRDESQFHLKYWSSGPFRGRRGRRSIRGLRPYHRIKFAKWYDVNMWKAKVYKPVSRLCRKRYKS